MKKKLAVQKFIESNPEWRSVLAEKPYCLQISDDVVRGRRLVMLKYSQIDSDFGQEIVRECRGLVLDADTLEVVSFPYRKFFNYGEPHADSVDWKTAKVAEKVDGSLIKVVKTAEGLLVSTNGTIDAEKAPVAEQIGCAHRTFADVFWSAVSRAKAADGTRGNESAETNPRAETRESAEKWLENLLEEGHTYMFELVSPWTRVVIPYPREEIYFLGSRDNSTFAEELFADSPLRGKFRTPRVFPLTSVDECLSATAAMPWNEEGYVVVDSEFRRNKIKSAAWLACHHLKGNGVMSYRRAAEIARANEVDEVLSYFPEFEKGLLEVKSRYESAKKDLQGGLDFLKAWMDEHGWKDGKTSRKDAAMAIVGGWKRVSGPMFAFLDGKIASADEWIMSLPSQKLVKFLGYDDDEPDRG